MTRPGAKERVFRLARINERDGFARELIVRGQEFHEPFLPGSRSPPVRSPGPRGVTEEAVEPNDEDDEGPSQYVASKRSLVAVAGAHGNAAHAEDRDERDQHTHVDGGGDQALLLPVRVVMNGSHFLVDEDVGFCHAPHMKSGGRDRHRGRMDGPIVAGSRHHGWTVRDGQIAQARGRRDTAASVRTSLPSIKDGHGLSER